MTTENIRVRFAPSPTGYLHVGGARTALFNYLFAKRFQGTYILRIEDTDRERSTPEAVDAIFESLQWLCINHDEGPFFQSQRTEIYQDYARKLLLSGHAYACTCSVEDLEKMRANQTARGEKPQYDGRCRPADANPQPPTLPTGHDSQPFVIRIRTPTDGETVLHDLILGEITTANKEIDDFIIIRSDGSPTYNFTVVVDDIDMKISHVIRGMDHVSNTPKQILIYQALNKELPQFAHVPMILGSDKKKLSKRHGATSVAEYKLVGYLPDAFINYLARLGWSHGDQEIFTRKELEQCFSLDTVGKSPAVFDFEKLLWVNAEHMKTCPMEELSRQTCEFLQADGFDVSGCQTNTAFLKLLESLRERSKTLREMASSCHFYLKDDVTLEIEETAKAQHLTAAILPALAALTKNLETLNSFTEPAIEELFHQVVTEYSLKLGKLAQPVRVAVTGSTVSPPIYTVLEALGKERSVRRLNAALKRIAPER